MTEDGGNRGILYVWALWGVGGILENVSLETKVTSWRGDDCGMTHSGKLPFFRSDFIQKCAKVVKDVFNGAFMIKYLCSMSQQTARDLCRNLRQRSLEMI